MSYQGIRQLSFTFIVFSLTIISALFFMPLSTLMTLCYIVNERTGMLLVFFYFCSLSLNFSKRLNASKVLQQALHSHLENIPPESSQ